MRSVPTVNELDRFRMAEASDVFICNLTDGPFRFNVSSNPSNIPKEEMINYHLSVCFSYVFFFTITESASNNMWHRKKKKKAMCTPNIGHDVARGHNRHRHTHPSPMIYRHKNENEEKKTNANVYIILRANKSCVDILPLFCIFLHINIMRFSFFSFFSLFCGFRIYLFSNIFHSIFARKEFM